jgi:BNR repeat-like domain
MTLVAAPAPCLHAANAPAGSATTPTIEVGPNMLVSRDGNFPHVELSVAANPRNPKNLVGAAITASRGEGGFACKTYSSMDGGGSWIDSSFPDLTYWGSGDPQVAFGIHGTAYFASLAFVKDEKGDARGGFFFYRSEDGGRTWQKPFDLGYSYDHEVMTVDQSFGAHSGRIYISVLYGEYPEYTLGVFRSDDDGRTFTGPVDAASGKKVIGINTAATIFLLRDGTLVLPYEDFEYDPEKSKKSHTSNMWIVSSSDGGLTFSQPTKVNTQEYNPDWKNSPVFTTFYAAAVDQSDTFPDRIYIVWTDYRTRAYRLLSSYSKDRGKTWSAAKPIDANVPEWSSQYQPMLAVNKDGVLGVSWFDTRNSVNHDDKQYDEYFAVSTDGGESFTPAVRLSDVISSPMGTGNVTPQASSFTYKNDTRVSFLSAVARWRAGGDYMGLTPDRDGVFHPFWADARTGTFQIQTATVTVKLPEIKKASPADSHGSDPPPATPAKVQISVANKVDIVFDPTSYDASTKVLDVPTRLRNVSQTPIYGPITLEVTKFGSGMGEELKEFTPTILNSQNHKEKDGATFDYTASLGTSQVLEPGATSGQVVWKIRLEKAEAIPDFHITLQGMVPEVK